MASMNSQSFLIQREATPGVPATDAMRSYQGLRARPGYTAEGNSFRGSGYRASTAYNITSESAEFEVEAPQDFNAILPVLASILGAPDSTPSTEAPEAATHSFALKGRGSRNPVSFTTMWGDEDFAFEAAYFVFNTLTFGVQRSDLTFDTSGIARTPDEDASLPAAASITEIPAIPIPTRSYDVYIDDSADDYGTTQYLSCYDANVSIGETWGQDTPINSAIVSFQELVENEEIDFNGEMQVGLKPAARDLFDTFRAGAIKYVRIAATGPVIANGVHYSLQIDYPIRITAPGTVSTAPNSPTVVMPFSYELTPDAVSGDLIRAEVTNTVLEL